MYKKTIGLCLFFSHVHLVAMTVATIEDKKKLIDSLMSDPARNERLIQNELTEIGIAIPTIAGTSFGWKNQQFTFTEQKLQQLNTLLRGARPTAAPVPAPAPRPATPPAPPAQRETKEKEAKEVDVFAEVARLSRIPTAPEKLDELQQVFFDSIQDAISRAFTIDELQDITQTAEEQFKDLPGTLSLIRKEIDKKGAEIISRYPTQSERREHRAPAHPQPTSAAPTERERESMARQLADLGDPFVNDLLGQITAAKRKNDIGALKKLHHDLSSRGELAFETPDIQKKFIRYLEKEIAAAENANHSYNHKVVDEFRQEFEKRKKASDLAGIKELHETFSAYVFKDYDLVKEQHELLKDMQKFIDDKEGKEVKSKRSAS